jgi:hypothetical protein
VSINRYPWQDDILRFLSSGESSSIHDLATAVSREGDDSPHDNADTDELRMGIAENLDHLVHLGLAEWSDGKGEPSRSTPHEELFNREARLTDAGRSAAASLP